MASALLLSWISWFLLANQGWAAIDIPRSCIQCLCVAISGSSSCDYNGGCHDGVCGPFAITYPYWQDGGRPTVGLDEDRQSEKAYENCALHITCSEATIQGYMNKFHQDCNGDGVEDCLDYAAIHFHGGYSCNKPLSVPVKNTLADCFQRLTPPVVPRPNPPVNPIPNIPEEPTIPNPPVEPEYPDENEILYPTQPTTFPSIDVRLGK